jgi:hypothetical protein
LLPLGVQLALIAQVAKQNSHYFRKDYTVKQRGTDRIICKNHLGEEKRMKKEKKAF